MNLTNPSLVEVFKSSAKKTIHHFGLLLGILCLRFLNWAWYACAVIFASLAHKLLVTKEYVATLAPEIAQHAIPLQKLTVGMKLTGITYTQTYVNQGSVLISNISGTIVLELFFFTIVFIALQSFLTLGFIRTTLNIVERDSTTFADAMSQASLIGVNVLLRSITFILIMFGTVCLIIPGIIVIIRSYFAQQILVDEHTSAWQAFTKSWELTRGRGMYMVSVACVMGILGWLGQSFMPLYLFIIPCMGIAVSSIYCSIRNQNT